jgi:hypothetical protein
MPKNRYYQVTFHDNAQNRYYQVIFHDNAKKQVLSWKITLTFLLMSDKDILILHLFAFNLPQGVRYVKHKR